jgi:GTP-sensing pleiotropic transcriptional regulator CodY
MAAETIMSERNPNRDEESGRYTQGYTTDDALDALDALDGAATTSEVGDKMGCARRTAYNKLRDLESENRVTSRDAGRTRLWLIADE